MHMTCIAAVPASHGVCLVAFACHACLCLHMHMPACTHAAHALCLVPACRALAFPGRVAVEEERRTGDLLFLRQDPSGGSGGGEGEGGGNYLHTQADTYTFRPLPLP